MPSRYIHSRLSSRQVPDLLQSIFVAELLTQTEPLPTILPCWRDRDIVDWYGIALSERQAGNAKLSILVPRLQLERSPTAQEALG